MISEVKNVSRRVSWNVFLEGLGTYWEPRGLQGGHFGVVGLILRGLGVHREAFGRPLGVFRDAWWVPESLFDRFRMKFRGPGP